MTQFVQVMAAALSVGAVYSLLAISLVVVYRSSRTVNFAQGELATLTTFIASSLIARNLPLGVAAALAIAAGFVISAAVYVVLIRPLSGRPEWTILLVGAGLFLGVNALCGTIWGLDPLRFPSIFPNQLDDYFTLFGARIYFYVVCNLLSLLVLTVGVAVLIRRTPIGLQMRAVAANPESADLMGISTFKVQLISWGVAGMLGSVAGILTAPTTTLSTQMMLDVLLYSLAAAILGGLDSMMGAALGGLLVAVVTTLLAVYVSWVGQQLQQAAAMVLIVALLVLRPSGLFGTARVERV